VEKIIEVPETLVELRVKLPDMQLKAKDFRFTLEIDPFSLYRIWKVPGTFIHKINFLIKNMPGVIPLNWKVPSTLFF
jgi:hypothetical protein